MSDIRCVINSFRCFPTCHRVAVVLIALACSNLAFAGEIHDAARNGDLEKVKTLVKDNPSLVFSKDNANGGTPLHWATANDHKEVVQFLLANNADVNAKDNAGQTPLHYAVKHGNREIAELLLSHKADVNVVEIHGLTPLHMVVEGTNKELANLVLRNNANIEAKDAKGQTPLHRAAAYDQKRMVELLLEKKAEINAADSDGETPLHWAAANGQKDVVELLIVQKAEINAKDRYGRTPLHEASGMGHEDIVELLLASAADANAKDIYGRSPLHWGAAAGRLAVVELLLKGKAEVNAKDSKDMTPLLLAEQKGHKDIVALLRQYGENDQNSGTSLSAKIAPETNKIGARPANWPPYSSELTGSYEVRVKNPNDFKVLVGLRFDGNGKDFVVSPNETESASIPNGHYDIYFNYSSDPGGLYQGDGFTLNNNGVEITITKIVNGNYGIRKVK